MQKICARGKLQKIKMLYYMAIAILGVSASNAPTETYLDWGIDAIVILVGWEIALRSSHGHRKNGHVK